MDDEVQLISDGDGLAVIGEPTAVERFLDSLGLLSLSKDLGSQRLGTVLRAGAGVARAGSEIASSGRWVKLTKESAQHLKEFGLTESKTPGVSWAMAGKRGSIKSWLQIETPSVSSLANPATFAGVAGIMAQLAKQHEADEFRDYLARINSKLDDVLRALKDAEVKSLIGAGFDIRSAITVREQTGRVDEITWSAVQGRTQTLTDALGWAILRLDALAEKVETTTKVGDLATTAKEAESEIQELLSIVAWCFELQDELDVLRLDRVMDAHPDELDGHRLALKIDHQQRRERVARATQRLVARVDAAAGTANLRVLLHPTTSRAVVGSINHVGDAVDDFHGPLGIEAVREALEATRWRDAARDSTQLKNAATEAGPKVLKGLGIAAVSVASAAVAKNAMTSDE